MAQGGTESGPRGVIQGRLAAALSIVTIILLAGWAGLVIGVSFVATPVKFSAPTLELRPAIDVGRVTFELLNRIEWWLAGALAVLAIFGRRTVLRLAVTALIIAIVLLQTFWLLPILDARSVAFVAGEPLPPSLHHAIFGVLESVKVLLLILTAALFARRHRQPA